MLGRVGQFWRRVWLAGAGPEVHARRGVV